VAEELGCARYVQGPSLKGQSDVDWTDAQARQRFLGEIVAMLFGDAVHFSKLDEDGVVRFGKHFLGAIGHLIATSPHAPLLKNTWGDGLFFVFPSVRHAGMFAHARAPDDPG